MTHLSRVIRALTRNRRAELGVVVFGVLLLVTVFAEVLASGGPLVAVGRRGILVFPTIVHPERYGSAAPLEAEALHATDFVVWPPVRTGPTQGPISG